MPEEDEKPAEPPPEDRTRLFGKEGAAGIKPPYLVIVEGPQKGARFPLQKGRNVIGRLDECHVMLEDQSVSRKHAELNFLQQGWTLLDLQSKNGTFVNGAYVEDPVVIGHKDLLRAGLYILRFVAEPIPSEEEMEIPPQEIEELGTVMAAPEEGEEGGDDARTKRLSVIPSGETPQASRDITAPHSPLEEEGQGLPAPVQKEKWLPKARLWLLFATLFGVALLAGLYFYWEYVLSPNESTAQKPSEAAVTPRVQPVLIPLGPPEPQKPKTIPIFLDCVANPFPALIHFQEKDLGKTPLKINVELEPNKLYEISAKFEMPELQETYEDRRQFQVAADQSMIPILFRAPMGTLKVTNLPRDAVFYLEAYFDYKKFEGKPIKITQLVLNKPIYAPYGRYILELRQPKEMVTEGQLVESIVFRREFFLKEEAPSFVVDVSENSLKEFPAEIHSEPSGATLFVDQKKVGQTPFIGTMQVGKHTLTLHKEGYFETNEDIQADINVPFKLDVTLKTTLAGEKINQGRDFINQALYQEALQSLSEVFSLTPTSHEEGEARYLLGNVYLQMGDFAKAQSYYDQAKSEEDFKYWAKLGLAQVLYNQKQPEQALIPLVEVLLNAKDEAILKEARNTLSKISPLRSVVYIQTDPPGAAVFLNDKKLDQVTPVLLHEMGLGTYQIHLEKPGYQPMDLSVQLSVNEFNPVLAKLKKIVK